MRPCYQGRPLPFNLDSVTGVLARAAKRVQKIVGIGRVDIVAGDPTALVAELRTARERRSTTAFTPWFLRVREAP